VPYRLAEIDSLRAASNRLREQGAAAARRLAEHPPAAVLDYASALDAVFQDCQRAFADMAEHADGHASDVRTLMRAWPVNVQERAP